VAPERAAQGEPTQHGVFGLGGAAEARPPGERDAPFLFERLKIDPVGGSFDAAGEWRHTIEVGAAAAAGLPDTVWVQAIVFEPPATGRAALTEVVELRLGGG
jgi:hypothetical protein